MNHVSRFLCTALCVVSVSLFAVTFLHGKDDFAKPKEFGVYVKTEKVLKRLMPNIVFDEKGLLYIEDYIIQRVLEVEPRGLCVEVLYFHLARCPAEIIYLLVQGNVAGVVFVRAGARS